MTGVGRGHVLVPADAVEAVTVYRRVKTLQGAAAELGMSKWSVRRRLLLANEPMYRQGTRPGQKRGRPSKRRRVREPGHRR